MKIYLSNITLEGSLLKGENPLPMFRDREKDKIVLGDGTLTEEEQVKMGYETGFRVLPYKIQDRYDRDRKQIELKTVVLENEYLKAVFLCEYGGRLYSLTDLETGRELLFTNKVFQLANLSTRNAWFSGGIEWNIGQFGHAFQTCEPVFFSVVKDDEGNKFLRMYEFERTKRLYYSIDFYLTEKTLDAYVKIINDDKESKPMYWWTNIAVPEERNVRIFSDTTRVIYIHPDSIGAAGNSIKKFGGATLPDIPSIKNLDATYPLNSPYSNEYFYQNTGKTSPWEAAVYDDGFMFFERSSQPLIYRKMFCWGNLKGGRKWQSFLSRDNEGAYLEIQGGLCPTQVHGMDMKGESVIDFVQVFSFSDIKDSVEKANGKNYDEARECVKKRVDEKVSENYCEKMLQIYRKKCENQIEQILSSGRGYGALEDIRREKFGEKKSPAHLNFPKDSMTDDISSWINLIEKGFMEDMNISDKEIVWMTDDNFKNMLLKSVEKKENVNALSLLHLGVMFYESFSEDRALEFWKESLQMKETCLVYRNIAYAYKQKEEYKTALEYMEKAVSVGAGKLDKAYYEEYFELLIKNEEYDRLIKSYNEIKNNFSAAQSEKLMIYLAKSYLEKSYYEKLLPIFEMKQTTLREGENLLLDIYFEYIARMKAQNDGVKYSDDLLREVRMKTNVPENLDFRMVIK